MIYSYAPKIPAREAQRDFPVLPGHGPRSAPQRRDFIALRGHAPQRAKRRGIFPSHEPSFAYAQLARQEPLGSLQNSHFAPQNLASCGLPLSHPHHRTGPEKTPLKTPVSERSERIGVFLVLPGHGPPARAMPRGQKRLPPSGDSLFLCLQEMEPGKHPACCCAGGRADTGLQQEVEAQFSGNSRWGWTAM